MRHTVSIALAAGAACALQVGRALSAEQGEMGPFPKSGLFTVQASDQTTRAGTADDPAIWVHPTDPALSLVIGTNKDSAGGLHVFDLGGNELQFVPGGQHNNVDLRYGFTLAGERVDLVSACDRNDDRIDVYKVDPSLRRLVPVGSIQAGIEVYGYAMYHSRATDRFYGIVASGDGIEQWELVDQGGSVGGVLARALPADNLIEGVVADDELGYLYLAEEDHGIYKYSAEPDQPVTRLATVDVVGSSTQLTADVEGLAIYYREGGLGYLIASSQGNDRFVVYRREGGNAYLGTFAVSSAEDTDGIDVINMGLGPLFPQGLFVAQNNDRDFQLVPWPSIANALGLAIDTQGYDVRGGGGCPEAAFVEVAPPAATIPEGSTVQLAATVRDASGGALAGCNVTWASSDAGVATVLAGGLVVGAGPGVATITATRDAAQGEASVTVENVPPVAHPGGPYSGFAGQPIAFVGSATDPGAVPLTFEWDFESDGIVDVTGPSTVEHAYPVPGLYSVSLRVRDGEAYSAVATTTASVTARPPVVLYLVLSSSATLGGVSVANEDVVAFDGAGFSLHFDGSDVGLASAAIDAFAVVGPTEILLSFTEPISVPGIAGTVDDSDLVKFTATSFGAQTAGSFTLYFDASDVGLTNSDEDVDAVELLPDGRLLLSTTGAFSVPGASGQDEDLLLFTPTSTGATTAGTWALYFDGSDVGLTSSDEDTDAVAMDGTGRLLLSTTGSFAVPGRSGADEDVFVFSPTSTGAATAGSFGSPLLLDGSVYGLGGNDVVAIDLP
jgi:myo-inositol-hexaphosphate 3-phosphohydrolase/PKD repeat protein